MSARPLLMSLKSIADLAQVERHTVSTWRSRNGASSQSPFPAPFSHSGDGISAPDLFRCEDVASWLEATKRTKGRDVHGDAPFYSELFDSACKQPLELLAALASNTGGDMLLAGGATPSPELKEDVQILVEAAFGERPLLTQIRRNKYSTHQERLSEEALAALKEAITSTLRVHPAPLVAASPMAASFIAEVVLSLDEDPVFPFEPETQCVFLPSINPNEPDYAFIELIAAELTYVGINVTRFALETDELPARSMVVSIALASYNVTPAYFAKLTALLTNLNQQGALLALAPTSLLLETSDDAVTSARQEFLAKTESGYVEPLRYSAQLPRRWAPLAGQRQPALWVFKRHSSETFPVALADLSGIAKQDVPAFVSNLVTALTEPDQLPRTALLSAKIQIAPEALRLGHISLTNQADNLSIHQPASSFTFAGKTGLAPAAEIGELWATAQRASLDPDMFEFVNSEPHQTIATIPWKAATSRGSFQVLNVIKGTKFAKAPELINAEAHSSGIGIVGPKELQNPDTWEARTIGLIDLDDHFPRTSLTEPGDVIVAPVKGEDRAIAVIDEVGSHVIEAPAFGIRCKKFRGRSHTPLKQLTLPQLVAIAINEANTANRSSWRIPVVSADMAQALTCPLKQIHKQRDQLRRALNNLERLEMDLLRSAVTGTIAPRPQPEPNPNPPPN